MTLFESHPAVAITLFVSLFLAAMFCLRLVWNSMKPHDPYEKPIDVKALSPMTDRERLLVENCCAQWRKDVATMQGQLADRDKEIAQLKDQLRALVKPTLGFDDED